MTLDKSAPRLPLLDSSDDPLAREQLAKHAAANRLLNLHRTMAHAPKLMQRSGDMAVAFRKDALVSRAVAELAVLRTAQVVDSDYVWGRHLPLAREAGVTERQIADVANWKASAAFSPAEKAALAFTEKAALGNTVDDATFAGLREHFAAREIVELTMLIGFYVSTALFIKALAIPPEKA